jgi:aldehyde dehydrogenase (NAD+)
MMPQPPVFDDDPKAVDTALAKARKQFDLGKTRDFNWRKT